MTTNEYSLRGWAETPDGRQERIFEADRVRPYVTPQQRSAVTIWLDARRRETPSDVTFSGGVDIYTGNEWIPFTDLLGRDMWSRRIRMEARS